MTQRAKDYSTEAEGIRILPGQWRPHYPFEQIVWISPPWPNQDYIWLDFPEAIFADSGLHYLSHVNPAVPALFHDLPNVPWNTNEDGLYFDRVLPNDVRFGGSARIRDSSSVSLTLYIENGSGQPLKDIRLQTCVYLRCIKEFADFTRKNKYVHTSKEGWVNFEEAKQSDEKGKYHLGFRGTGPAVSDLPVMVTVSNLEERLVAMTWYESTVSMVANPKHPCMHADPAFPDLDPGDRGEIHGEILFFEGTVEEFGERFPESSSS